MNIEELNKEYKDKMDALMEEYKEKAKEIAEEEEPFIKYIFRNILVAAKEIAEEEEPFIKKGQGYFIIDKDFKIDRLNYDGDSIDRELLDTGNMFPYTYETEDKIKKEVNLIAERRKLQSEMEMFARLNNTEKIDWNNNKQMKWNIYIDYDNNDIRIDSTCCYRDMNTVDFDSREIAEKALDKFGDRIRKLYMEEK